MFMVCHHMYHLQMTYYQALIVYNVINDIINSKNYKYIADDDDLKQFEYIKRSLMKQLDRD